MRILAGPDNWTYYSDNWRKGLADHDLVTFSHGNGGIQYQPGRSSFQDILAQLPEGWEPELVIWWFPEFQEVLPDIHQCPYPTMVQISDWHTVRDELKAVAQHFDLVATDRMGTEILKDIEGPQVFEAPLYGFDPEVHRRLDDREMLFDVSHVGDLNPFLHQKRVQMLARAAEGLGDDYTLRFFSGLQADNYVWVLNHSRITLNYAVRREMSMRCFEAPACGSLLFCEESNESAREILRDGQHCVYYNEANLVEKLRYYLEHEEERAALAQAGWERIQQFSYRQQSNRLIELARQHLGRSQRSALNLLDYWAATYNPAPPAVAYQQSHAALDETPERQNLRACVEARIGYSLADIDMRIPFFQDAGEHFQSALDLSCLVPLSLARVRWMVCEPEASLDALQKAQQTPFRPVSFFPRQTGEFHFLWEREPERREQNTRWQIADLLAQLEPDKTVEHCRQALEHRSEAGVTWFRLGLALPRASPERLEALREASRLHPAFGPARLAVARELADQGLREELGAWLQASMNLALAFPHLKGLKEGITRLLQRLAQTQEVEPIESVEQFANGITFDWLQPDEPIPTELSDRLGTLWERHNTRFPCDQDAILERFSRLDGVPRMSTLAIAALLQRVVAQMPADQTYVNVGVWHGFTFLASLLDNSGKRCVGVDDFSQFGGPEKPFRERFEKLRGENHEFHSMDYQVYFRDVHQGKLGAYLYDGDHSYEHQLRGLQIAEPHFAPGCIVLVDDTNWDGARNASLDFVAQSSRRYELIFDVRTAPNLAPSYWNGYHPTWWNGWMMWRCLD